MQVQPIVQEVKNKGDAAVKQYTEKFDRVQLDTVCCPINVSLADTCSDWAGALNGLKSLQMLTLLILSFRTSLTHSSLRRQWLLFRLPLTISPPFTMLSRGSHSVLRPCQASRAGA